MDKKILNEFLKAGFLHESVLVPSEEGTPRGGFISPTIANMTLDGLEKMLSTETRLVRYADDFIVIGNSKESLTNETLPVIEKFLAERNLSLSDRGKEKTRVVSIEEGFDFLGYTFREYPDPTRLKGYKKGIFLIKPSKTNVSLFKKKIKHMVKKNQDLPSYVLITKLNRALRGWAEHYRTVTSKKVFSLIGAYLWKTIWTGLCKRYKNVPKRILKDRFFKSVDGNRWVFYGKDTKGNEITLFQMGWVSIKRHTLCLSINPFLPENADYFVKRVLYGARVSILLNKNNRKLLTKQKGICPLCENPLLSTDGRGEALEVHHIRSRKDGGSDSLRNLLLLHKICHKEITYGKNPAIRASLLARGIIRSN